MMKKQLLFCSLALASSMTAFAEVGEVVTDLTQLSNTKCYTITPRENARGTWYYNAADASHLYSTDKPKVTVSTTDPAQQFAFIKSESGRYYVYSVGGDKFLQYSSDGTCLLVDKLTSSDSYATFVSSDKNNENNKDYPWVVALNDHHVGISNGYQYGVITNFNSTNDNGNCIKIVEAGDLTNSDEVVNKVKLFETAYTEEHISQAEEANTYLKVPEGAIGGYDADLWNALNEICGGDGVADFYDVVNPGFSEALQNLKNSQLTTAELSNDKVYQLVNMTTSNGYLCAKDGDDYVYVSSKAGNAIMPNSDKWQLYQEDGKYYLYNQGKKAFVKYNASANKWEFTAVPTVVDIERNESKGAPYSLFWIKDTESSSDISYLHVSTGYDTGVVGWNTDADNTHFYVVEISDAEVDQLVNIGLKKAKMEADKIITAYDETKIDYVGCYSKTAIDALKEAYNDPNATASSVEEALTNAANSRKQVEAGKYYQILNTMSFTDGGVKAIYENPDGTNVAWHTTEGTAAELWQFEQEEGGDGDYYIKSSNTGKYIELMLGAGSGTVKETASTPFRFTEQGSNLVSFGLQAWNEANSDKATLVLQTGNGWGSVAKAENESGNYIGTYNAFNATTPSIWNIVEVSSVNLTIGETGYATAYFPFAVTIPEGVKAYTVSAAADGVATLSPLTGTIPANTGVILSGDAKTYPFAITTSTASAVEDNLLNGVTIATDLDPETSYILANGANGLGFYKVDPTDTKLAANKAYLNNANGSFFSLKLDGAVTGIQSVENAAENAPAYDLQGRRLPQVPTKGLYIQNGKKIMK